MREGLAGEFMDSPRQEKSLLCLARACNVRRAYCVVGLMLVLGRGVWVKEIRKITLTS